MLVETITTHLPLSRDEAFRKAVSLLKEVGIPAAEERIGHFPHQFSGGMRQRVVIALALCADPCLIIADEPTTALDVSVQAQIITLLKRLCRDHGTAVMLITHDMGVIAETAHRVAVMYAGRLVEIGPVWDVVKSPFHPYTAGLMACIPAIGHKVEILTQIEGRPQTLLFSATLDGAVGTLISRYQHDPVHREIASTVEAIDALDQRFIGVTAAERVAVTAAICAGAARALVFVSTTRGADRLVEHLEGEGLRCAAIHGRLSQNKRERVLAAFIKGKTPVLVATNVAARGIHVSHIDVVVHYDPPEDAKVYLHRSGRTARAGDRGLVVTLALPEYERDITRLVQEIGSDHDIVTMRPDDVRLADLAAWEPPPSTAPRIGGTYSMRPRRRAAARPQARGPRGLPARRGRPVGRRSR